MTNFLGWKFGSDIRRDQADKWNPVVNILEEILYECVSLNAWKMHRDQISQHELLANVTEALGNVAENINNINSRYMYLNQLEADYNDLLKPDNEEAIALNVKRREEMKESIEDQLGILRENWLRLGAEVVVATKTLDNSTKKS